MRLVDALLLGRPAAVRALPPLQTSTLVLIYKPPRLGMLICGPGGTQVLLDEAGLLRLGLAGPEAGAVLGQRLVQQLCSACELGATIAGAKEMTSR